jgi:Asp-tRNA(Asn)/Glu-tRNA(Gln) amidotransferase A subunit family amidase
LPANDADIAYASVAQLSRWIQARQITSERLTRIYLDRLQQFDPKLHCVITLTRDHALEQARQADAEIAAGKYRGSLHGIPWGAKDLLDTAGIPTTYGAEPYRDRVPKKNSAVAERLNAAGAVLVAKLSLGALALNDIWFGGQTMNPWLLEEGASGSSAGPGASTAAGLVGFAIGSDALRRYWSAANLWTRAAHRSDDAVLVARQAGTDGAVRRRHDTRVERDLRAGSGRCCQRSKFAIL